MPTKLTFHGHSCFQIETAGKRILIDPFLTSNPAANVAADELAPDYIIVSHGHFDHIHDAAGIAKRTGATCIANFEICEWLAKHGVKNVHAQNTGGAFRHPFGVVKLTIAHHSSMLPDGSNGGCPCGVLLTLEDATIYYTGDTALFLDMQLYGEEGVDLAILPIGGNYTMGPDDALRAVKLINPRAVIPVHYDTFDLIAQDAATWAGRVSAETSAKPVILKPGESHTLTR